jgi:hypothetical protein
MAILSGLLNQTDIYANRVTDVGVTQVFRAIDESVAEHNRVLNALMRLFARPVTTPQTRYNVAAIARLQPLDENGRARPIKPSGAYTVGFPLHDAGIAWGRNYRTSIKMNVGDVARIVATMLDADSRWMRDHVLAALFFENSTTPWTFNDVDDEIGALSVYGLANGDTTTYQIMAGADSAATDDHVKGAAAVTAAVFTDIHDELVEHAENGDQVIALVPTASKSTVEGLTGFYPIADPNLRSGSGVTELARTLNVETPGKLFGYIEGVWTYEWAGMPANYLIGTTVGGEPALGMRQEPEAELQGFNKVAERADHPWWEAQYLRIAGFGGWNRVGAIVYRTDNATYAIPTGYTSPMG